MADDAFHEIRLDGKQLVFVFMAATVVAVVTFPCGVMVGRGVRAHRGELIAAETPADPTADVVAPAPSAPLNGTTGTSPATRESLSYPDRLAADAPPVETLKAPVAGDVPPASPAPARRAADTPGSPEPADKPARREVLQDAAAAGGFTVQGAAIRE